MVSVVCTLTNLEKRFISISSRSSSTSTDRTARRLHEPSMNDAKPIEPSHPYGGMLHTVRSGARTSRTGACRLCE
jgi:hypothetical protein